MSELAGGRRALVPGSLDRSEMWRRIQSDDPDEVMPPAHLDKPLTAAQKELLKQWIEAGAPWAEHWAFVKPQRPVVPETDQAERIRNPIDSFIFARLKREGLEPSPEADKRRLARRLSLDLTGLPPTLEQLNRFLADDHPEAYERYVDRLLASPHFGERMAVDWLDAARYADSNGYYADPARHMTHWRDWVINAYNRNLPFDQFTIEQLAGDLLPEATRDQIIASGFHRNHMITTEGGSLEEEFRAAYVADRVNTTSTVWLGLTMGCAQCHDHKYDPLTQKEYFQLAAYFNSIEEVGVDGVRGNAQPYILTPTAAQQRLLDEYHDEISRLSAQLALADSWKGPDISRSYSAATLELEPTWDSPAIRSLQAGAATVTEVTSDGTLSARGNPGLATDRYVVQAVASGGNITAFRLKALPNSAPRLVKGAGAIAVVLLLSLLGWRRLRLAGPPRRLWLGRLRRLAFAGAVASTFVAAVTAGVIVGVLPGSEWIPAKWLRLDMGPGRTRKGSFHLTDVALKTKLPGDDDRWTWIPLVGAATDDGRSAMGTLDGDAKTGWHVEPGIGETCSCVFLLDKPLETKPDQPLEIVLNFGSGAGGEQLGRFRIETTSDEFPLPRAGIPKLIRTTLAEAPAQRTADQTAALSEYYRSVFAEKAHLTDVVLELAGARKNLDLLEKQASTMVMRERAAPRETFVLHRGVWDQPREKVTHGVPAVLPPLPADAKPDRLALARWLVGPDHPLTARVTVNRIWQAIFGQGLVRTPDDFGNQGERPTHPELLDWLAVEFRDTLRWDVKRLVRMIVTSTTYRQSSDVSRELLSRDPENLLLARAPRFRLSAEFIRDQAVATAGLLNTTVGGESVFPYQPAGLWREFNEGQDPDTWGDMDYKPSRGADLYRRSVYTFWKRAVPPPNLALFDAPSREVCTVCRPRTNTPLQALVTLNDPTFVEAARNLGELMRDSANHDQARISNGFERTLSRQPTRRELALLEGLLQAQREHFGARPEEARRLLKIGESPQNSAVAPEEAAAWAVVAQVLLNLDETLCRG